MILATITGWLIIVKEVKTKSQHTVVEDLEHKLYTVRKNDPSRKLFTDTQPAIDWIMASRRN